MKKRFCLLLILFIVFGSSCREIGISEKKEMDASQSNRHLYGELTEMDGIVYFMTDNQADGFRKIMYYDKATDSIGYLCGKPECTHDTADCNAAVTIGGAGSLGFCQGKLYWTADAIAASGAYDGLYLYCMNSDGTDRKKVRLICEADDLSGRITGSKTGVYIDGFLIESGGRSVITGGETKQFETIRAYSLSNPKRDRTILDIETDGRIYTYASEGFLYYSLTTQDARKEGEAWNSSKSHFELYRYNFKDGSTEKLFEDEVPFYAWEFSAEGDEVLISTMSDENSSNKACVLNLKEKRIVREIEMEGSVTGIAVAVDRERCSFYIHPDNDPEQYRIVVKDKAGNVISDTNGLDYMATEELMPRMRIYAGMDENNSYYIFRESFNGNQKEWLIAYPLSGGEPKQIYTNMTEEEATAANERKVKINDEPFSVRIELSADWDGSAYVVESYEEAETTVYQLYWKNNTDDEMSDTLESMRINGRKVTGGKGDGNKCHPHTEDVYMDGMLEIMLNPYDFSDGAAVISYECRIRKEDDPETEYIAYDEVLLRIKDAQQ